MTQGKLLILRKEGGWHFCQIPSLEKKLTDMYLDDKISKEAYDDKYSEIGNKLDKCEEEKRVHSFQNCNY